MRGREWTSLRSVHRRVLVAPRLSTLGMRLLGPPRGGAGETQCPSFMETKGGSRAVSGVRGRCCSEEWRERGGDGWGSEKRQRALERALKGKGSPGLQGQE